MATLALMSVVPQRQARALRLLASAAAVLALPAPALTCQQPLQTAPVTIEVIDPDGRPVKGAMIEVLRFEGGDAPYSSLDIDENNGSRVVSKLPTPKNGRLGIQLPIAIPHRIRVDVPPYAVEHRAAVYAGHELSIALRPGATVTGVVRDTLGAPLADAKVELTRRPRAGQLNTTTDAAGRFRFERVMPGPVSVDAKAPQAASDYDKSVSTVSGDTTEVGFALDRGTTIHGRVRDATTNEPIAGARFGVGWTMTKSVFTDQNGLFEWHGLGGPFGNCLFLDAPGYCEMKIARPAADGKPITMELRMDPGLTVTGQVVGVDGRPAADCYVAVVGIGGSDLGQETDWLSQRTDPEGRFAIAGVRGELAPVLLIRHDGFATQALPLPDAQNGTVAAGKIQLQPRVVVQGIVLDVDRQPLANQDVVLTGWNEAAPNRIRGGIFDGYLGTRTTQTDALGRFYFGDLGPGNYRVTARGESQDANVTANATLDMLEFCN